MKPRRHNPPRIVIIGRPNVGKSTLFNRIAGRRRAVVEKASSTTRDRVGENVNYSGRAFELVDTGGLDFDRSEKMTALVERQVVFAIEEADGIVFVCDGKDGVMPLDEKICDLIRKYGKDTVLVVNKVDSKRAQEQVSEFYTLGMGDPVPVSGLHGSGIADLAEIIFKDNPSREQDIEESVLKSGVRMAVVGRPNAGKSLFVNTLLGEERVIVSPEPGTTRDSVDTYLERDGKGFIIIDTAGIRSKAKIKDPATYFSVLRTGQSVKRCDVCTVLIDGMVGIEKEDCRIIDIVQKAFKPFVLVMNKWDICGDRGVSMKDYEALIRKNLRFICNAPILFISSLTGEKVLDVLEAARGLALKAGINFSTDRLNAILRPIAVNATRIYSIRQTGNAPPGFEIVAKAPEAIDAPVRNHIVNRLRDELGLNGIPIRINFKRKVFRK